MEIKIYGSGCQSCVKLADNAKKAVAETGVEAEIIKVEGMKQIAMAGVMSTPAIAVDGDVKAKGRIAAVEEIKEMLN